MAGSGIYLAPSSGPFVLELDRLQNLLREKDRELTLTQAEVKALKANDYLKDKAVKQLNNDVDKVKEKLQLTENLIEQRNLEIKKLIDEKKEALTGQFAAEAALRRIHTAQKDDDSIPINSVIAPMEADIKMYKNQVAKLQEDKKTLERINKSKEAALVEANDILKTALERALIVEKAQNRICELERQVETYQEEYRILDKSCRQKVDEVEKLSQTIRELEESILAGGEAANAMRDFRRQISDLKVERRSLERELAKANVSANRVAKVVANEWKGESDKVMPVKQWLEERKYFQGELQRLREKLTIAEKSAKTEAQLKDKMHLRLKVLEEGLKHVSSIASSTHASPKSQESENLASVLEFSPSSTVCRKRSTSQPRARLSISEGSLFQPHTALHAANSTRQLNRLNSVSEIYGSGGTIPRKNLQASSTKMMNEGEKENANNENCGDFNCKGETMKDETSILSIGIKDETDKDCLLESGSEDYVSGFLYDRIQKEVINLRKICEEKDGKLNTMDNEIKILMKKIATLTKARETDVKKLKGESPSSGKVRAPTDLKDRQRSRNICNQSTILIFALEELPLFAVFCTAGETNSLRLRLDKRRKTPAQVRLTWHFNWVGWLMSSSSPMGKMAALVFCLFEPNQHLMPMQFPIVLKS